MIRRTKTSLDTMPLSLDFRLPAQIVSGGGWRTGKWHNPQSKPRGLRTVLRRRFLIRHDPRILSFLVMRATGSMFPGQILGLGPFQASPAHPTSTLIILHYFLRRHRVSRLESFHRRTMLLICPPRLDVLTLWMNQSAGKPNYMNRRHLPLRDGRQATTVRRRHRPEQFRSAGKALKRQSRLRCFNNRNQFPRYHHRHLEDPRHRHL